MASQRHDLLDDDEEDEMALKVLIAYLGMENEVQKWRSHGGSSLVKRANIDRECEIGYEKIILEKIWCIHLTFSDVTFECNSAYI